MRIRTLRFERKHWIFILLGILIILACDLMILANLYPAAVVENTPTQILTTPVSLIPLIARTEISSAEPLHTSIPMLPAPIMVESISTEFIPTNADNTSSPMETEFDPVNWMEWSVIPATTQHAREIYALGQSLGNDPRAFSVFGDCQSVPNLFLSTYISDSLKFAELPANLQETTLYFKDSLGRNSPTVKNGTTTGALLWAEWHENKYGCQSDEKPMDCELRLHKPSFVLIMVGTHSEGKRDENYMRKILDTLLLHGVVPILSTKSDNREGDSHINLQAAQLAAEYDIPLWNFWRVTSALPNRGLYTKEIDRHLGDIYLTKEALELHRYSALQVLDAVWRVVK